MWELVNRTPFAAERAFARDGDGAEVLVVAVKATFGWSAGGVLGLADVQEPVHLAPVHGEGPDGSRLLHDTDLYLDKPATDVLLRGHAHALPGEGSFEAGFRVGPVEKRVSVARSGERRAIPVDLGPIPRDRPPRAALAGTHDARWERERMPLPPLDFDLRYHQCAPPDQQAPGYLRGGELVELTRLTPGGALAFTLPRVRPIFRTRIAGRVVRHRGNLHTVVLEPDRRRLILVWHTALPCHRDLYTLRRTTVLEEPGGEP